MGLQVISSQGTTNTAASISVSVSGVVVDDLILSFQVVGNGVGTISAMANASAWTSVGSLAPTVWSRTYVSAAFANTNGTFTVTATRDGQAIYGQSLAVVLVRGADRNVLLDGALTTNGAASAAANAALTVAGTTTTKSDALFIGSWTVATQSATAPTITRPPGSTLVQQIAGGVSGAQNYLAIVSEVIPTPGATASHTLSSSVIADLGWAGLNFVLRPGYIPVDLTDSATGSDSHVLDRTDQPTPSDSAVATDTPLVDRFRTPDTDAGIGSDSIVVDSLTPLPINTDSATSTDSVTVAFFIGNDLTEAGTASDPVDVNRTLFQAPTDAGTATDAYSLLEIRNTATDNGVGSETTSSIRFPVPSDQGVGEDLVSVLDIPFTQVVRRDAASAATVYDLVVVARIPSATGIPSFLEVDPIEWKTLTYTNTLGGAQELTATAQVSSITEPVLQRLRKPHELATELKLYRNGQVVFTGPLLGWQTSGETLTVKAGGLMAYLKLMVVTSDMTFTGIDQNLIVKALVDQWQSQAYGNFGIDTSSITASGVLRTIAYKKAELHNVATRIDDLGKLDLGFDAEVNPASRKLQLWSPKKGIDRSSGEDAIVFDDRNVTSSDIVCSVAIGDLASDAYGAGSATGSDEPFYATASNDELRAKYGKSAVTESFSNLKTQADVTGNTKALLDARGEALMIPGPKVRVTPDANIGAYDIGDLVAYDLGGTISVSGSFRIRKQSISATPTGQETVDLEFV